MVCIDIIQFSLYLSFVPRFQRGLFLLWLSWSYSFMIGDAHVGDSHSFKTTSFYAHLFVQHLVLSDQAVMSLYPNG